MGGALGGKHGCKGDSRQYGNAKLGEIVESRVVESRRPRRIIYVTWGNENHHSLPSASEQNSVSVAEIASVVWIGDTAPPAAAEIMETPSRARET